MESCGMVKGLGQQESVNVAEGERFLSVGAGSVLASWGVQHLLSASGLLALLAGGALIHRGVTGQCALYAALESQTGQSGRREFGEERRDRVEEAGQESFPASDSPAWSEASGSRTSNPMRYRAH